MVYWNKVLISSLKNTASINRHLLSAHDKLINS